MTITHALLGSLYGEAGDLERALRHYRKAVAGFEALGDRWEAAYTRRNVAVDLFNAGYYRYLVDAQEFARAAWGDFRELGPSAAAEAHTTRGLLTQIEQRMQKPRD
jgi:hypothetical protein